MELLIDFVNNDYALIDDVIDYYYTGVNDLVVEVGDDSGEVIDLWYVVQYKGNRIRKVTRLEK